jgi:hypothetical protein
MLRAMPRAIWPGLSTWQVLLSESALLAGSVMLIDPMLSVKSALIIESVPVIESVLMIGLAVMTGPVLMTGAFVSMSAVAVCGTGEEVPAQAVAKAAMRTSMGHRASFCLACDMDWPFQACVIAIGCFHNID